MALPGVAAGYVGSAVMGSYTIDTLLRGQQKAAGMVPAIHVTGARHMMSELKAHRVLGDPVDVIR